MAEKKEMTKVESVAWLREQRYMTKGPGAKRTRPPAPASIEKLRTVVAKVAAKKKPAKKSKGRRR